jgi:hypothetical protein
LGGVFMEGAGFDLVDAVYGEEVEVGGWEGFLED